jgi:hypothetical protein
MFHFYLRKFRGNDELYFRDHVNEYLKIAKTDIQKARQHLCRNIRKE